MPKYTIKLNATGPLFTKTGVAERSIRVPTFTAEQMKEIGEYDVGLIKDRVSQLQDVYDRPEPELSPKYARRKQSKGLPPVRDLFYSGIMLSALQILESDESHVKIGIKGAVPFRKALFNQNVDPWFGLSGRDEERLMEEKVRPLFNQNIQDLLRG